MCKAFSCIITKAGNTYWKLGVDSHEDLIRDAYLLDQTTDKDKLQFARVEISPDNSNYLEPDKWTLHLDESIKPAWWDSINEKQSWAAHKKWLTALNKILVHKPIVQPFTIKPPQKITKKHIDLVKKWASVRDSVWDSVGASVRDSVRASVWDSVRASVWTSVWDSVWDSVRASVWDSVRASVWTSVWDSVWDSVRASVRAYSGSFFALPRKSWKYTDKIKSRSYPFQPVVDLWEMGLVPSFDGKTWRLHGGPNGDILWSGKC